MTLQDLQQREAAILNKVGQYYQPSATNEDPITDGVVNPERYLNAPARVLWILKEPWDGNGGDWSLSTKLDEEFTDMAKVPTYQPIVYVTYGIFNSIWDYQDMDYIRDDASMALVLRDIAYINVKKVPGGTTADNSLVLSAYHNAKELILEQIKAYEPQYIIGCGPHMPHIMADLGVKPEEIKNQGSVDYARTKDALLLSVYHPVQHVIKREVYVNEILSVIAGSLK